jgi:hypothetical protein
MFLADVVSGLLRPASCLACGAPGAWPCCARCLPPDPGDVGPWPLAADPEVALWALGPYRDALRAAVLAGKLDGQPAALAELGRCLGAALAAAGIGADLVTYVSARRVAGHPRDHATQIAGGVATALDLPLVDLLAPARGRDLGLARGRDLGLARGAGRSGRAPPPRPPRQPGVAWPAVASCWSTTWPPPAAPSPGPPTPSASRAPARSRPPSWPPCRTPSWPPCRAPSWPPPRAPPWPPSRARLGARVRASRPGWPEVADERIRPAHRAALCGCDPFSCVESGQYDQRAGKRRTARMPSDLAGGALCPIRVARLDGGYGRLDRIVFGNRMGSCQCR